MTINPDMPISLPILTGNPERKTQGTGENNQQKDTFTPSPTAAGSIPSQAVITGAAGAVSPSAPSAGAAAPSGGPDTAVTGSAISVDKAAGVLFDRTEKLGGTLWQSFLDHDYDRYTPATGADGTVYTISAGGYISAVKEGKVQWSCDIDHDFGGSKDDDKHEFKRGSSPAVGPDNTVYTVSHGGYASAVKDGKIVWEHSLEHTYDGSSPALGADGTLYSVSAGGYASAVKDGKIVWEHSLEHNYEGSSPALGADGTLYSVSAGGYATAMKDGKIVWEHNLEHNYEGSSPAAGADGTMYTVSAGGYATAVKDGKVLWEHFLDHNYKGSSPAVGPDGTLYVLSAGGYATAVKDGKVLWEHFLDHNYEGSSPAVAPDGTFCTLSAGGYTGALKDGKVLWESFLDHNYEGSSPVLSPDGSSLLSISVGGYLTAVRSSIPKPDMAEIDKPAEVTDKPTIQQEEEYIIVGGVKLPVDK